MVQTTGTQMTCPNCRQPFTAILEQIIDIGRDPQAKARLLTGRTNLVTCPNCGFQTMLATPMIYHDPQKELLITYIPMELGLPQMEQDRLVGSLTNAIMSSLPQDQRKGYLLTPKTALSVQGLVEMVLEADGITKEMIEAQRAKMRLIETFLQVDADDLPALVQVHNDKLDTEFFAMLNATTDAAIGNGRRDVAEQMLALREQLLQLSTTGQELLERATVQEAAVQEVAEALNALGDNATQEDFLDLAIQLVADGSDDKLQALVGLARPLMDYQFFQLLSERIDNAADDEKAWLEGLRDRLLELTSVVDQQNEAVLREATDTLRSIVNSADIEAAIRTRVELLDDTFLAVLSANIQNAEQRKDVVTAARLKTIFEKVVAILQESAPPPVRFINELMQQQNFDDARKLLQQRAHEFGPELIQWMEMLSDDLGVRGNTMALDRLTKLREEAERVLGGAATSTPLSARPSPATDGPVSESPSGIVIPFARKRSKKQ